MSIKKIIYIVMAAAVMSVILSGCKGKNNSSGSGTGGGISNSQLTGDSGDSNDTLVVIQGRPSGSIEGRSCSPVISVSSAEGKPGESVSVTVSVTGAAQKWQGCGIHIVYNDVIKPALRSSMPTLDYEKGDAIALCDGFVIKEWEEEHKHAYLRNNSLGSVFFTAAHKGNLGLDGDIVTFKLIIPDDAVPGTVYDVGLLYVEGDIFANASGEKEMQNYAFQNWQGGTITVI